jgi:hypothetical protein
METGKTEFEWSINDRISVFRREILTMDSDPCLTAGTPKLKVKVEDCHIA